MFLNTWINLKWDAPKYNNRSNQSTFWWPCLLWALLLRPPCNLEHFQTLPLQMLHSFLVPPLPFSKTKCCFLPSFVWLFSKLSLSFFAFPQTLKGNGVAYSYCRHPSWGPSVLPAVPTPLWCCWSLIPCTRGALLSRAHCASQREQALIVLPVKAQRRRCWGW